MTHVITSLCVRDGACVEVCPVECIVPGSKGSADWPLFYIDPDTCIDCGACVPECPVEAIFPEDELPAEYAEDLDTNAAFFDQGPGYWDFDLEAERVRD
jgi:ferredoxin